MRGIHLIGLLGQGGMGEVYLGIDERLGRRVAVKAIRGEERLDPLARARLLREARVLSQLEHPNVCRLYEYVEGDNADFLVLELVDGSSLRALMGEKLPRPARMAIALQVAEALVAAHALSIVHRDLKPENVMVAAGGGVKVLDFGLARPLAAAGAAPDGPVAPATAGPADSLTQLGAVMGTPRYMSPEQARGEPLTAASDMYSFGLLLQELFTGRAPVDLDVSRDVMVQRARWGETRPVEGIERNLTALIDTLKALSPADRPSASAAAARLRWIADRPRRLLRRALAAGVAMGVASAAIVSTIGFVRAKQAQRRAERSEARARQAQEEASAVNAFLRDMLTSPDPREMGIHVEVGDVLDRAASSADRALAGQPASQAAVLDTLGSSFLALGEPEKARQHLTRALDMRTRLKGTDDADTWRSMQGLGTSLVELSRFGEGIPLLRQALDGRKRRLGADHADTLETTLALARALQRDRQFEESRMLYGRAYEGRRSTLGPRHPDTLEALRRYGTILTDFEAWDEAESMLRGAYQGALENLGGAHPQTIAALSSLATFYGRRNRDEEAEPLYAEALERTRSVLGAEHPSTLHMATAVGLTWSRLGRYAEALRLLRKTREAQARVLGPANHETLETMRDIGAALLKTGRWREAESVYRERWTLARRHRGEEDRITLETKSTVANVLLGFGRVAEAERLYREVLTTRRRIFGENHEATVRSKHALAGILSRTGRTKEAQALAPASKE